MRESKIEKEVCDYARKHHWLVYKFTSPGNRGVPDKIFIRNGAVFFIEFKAPNKTPSKLQKLIADRIKGEGIAVYTVDSIEYGKDIIDTYKL